MATAKRIRQRKDRFRDDQSFEFDPSPDVQAFRQEKRGDSLGKQLAGEEPELLGIADCVQEEELTVVVAADSCDPTRGAINVQRRTTGPVVHIPESTGAGLAVSLEEEVRYLGDIGAVFL